MYLFFLHMFLSHKEFDLFIGFKISLYLSRWKQAFSILLFMKVQGNYYKMFSFQLVDCLSYRIQNEIDNILLVILFYFL